MEANPMSKIQAELMDALKLKEKKGEARLALLKRIFSAVNEMDDKLFHELSSAAQKWANTSATANDATPPKALPEFPDYKPETAEADESETTVSTKTPKAAKAAKDAKPAAEAKVKKPAKEKKAAEPKAKKGPGKLDRIRALIVKKPALAGEALKAAVVAAGIEVTDTTIAAVRSDLMACIRVLQRAGKLTEDMVELD
jgi:hypothetical protein